MRGGTARTWRGRLRAVAFVLAALASPLATAGEPLEGVALVIGQSDYEHLQPLANPANDAREIDRLLGDLGFEVDGVTDADGRKLARSLERLVEDAEGADVALVYYAGHGIEAGGENFLVPVDASATALDAVGDQLQPLSAMVAELQTKVPLVIVLLDACRSNPFPAGARVTIEPGAAPVPVSGEGLGAPRGAGALPRQGGSKDAIGTLIGFAAAPGRVALDGQAGGNSPYAAALLKHLSAGGYSISDVMTMVTEEVWLRTGARQLPWTNASLRRSLVFGAPASPEGEEAAIRTERRGLLLTISTMDESERQQVAGRAREEGVPMDALFAMLAALGADAPDDPEALDSLLREQAGRLKTIIAERDALGSADPEIVRLAGLSQRAVEEGALAAAIGFNERAKARVEDLSRTLDDAEAQLAARRAEFAAVYAKSAQTYALSAEHLASARDYEKAFRQVERWDRDLAWKYRVGQADALTLHGHYAGDTAALGEAIDTWRDALALAPRADRALDWARSQRGLGLALWSHGDRLGSRAEIEQAVAALEAALEVETRAKTPEAWADTRGQLGGVLMSLAAYGTDHGLVDDAVAAFREAMEIRTRETAPAEWARLQNRLSVALQWQAARVTDNAVLHQALAAAEASLLERERDRVPYDWAQSENNRALILSQIGVREGRVDVTEQAAAAFSGVLEVFTRERTPILWAETEANRGAVLWQLAINEPGTDRAVEAAAAFRRSLEVLTRETSPQRHAAMQDNLGVALKTIGERRNDQLMVEEAIAAFRASLGIRTREDVPLLWAGTSLNLANALYALGFASGDRPMLEEAIAVLRAVLDVYTRDSVPAEWARTKNNLGNALWALGVADGDVALLDQAVAALDEATEIFTAADAPFDYGRAQYNKAEILLARGLKAADRDDIARALDAVLAGRAAYLEASQGNFAQNFDTLELQIRLADLKLQVEEQAKRPGENAPKP